ncbi:unnamed protein product, partial [Porites lobata]
MKEKCDQGSHWVNLRNGRPIQERLAKLLHQEAGVPEGPCDLTHVQKFQDFLGPQGYQIVVVCAQNAVILPRTDDKRDLILEGVIVDAEEEHQKSDKINIFIAAFTTCHARLKLYDGLDTLKEQVLYYDTDSIIYRWRPG